MLDMLHHAISQFSGWYADSATLRTTIGFAHVGGLLIGGGSAIAADRGTLAVWRSDEASRLSQARALDRTHGVVISSLVVVVASGLLLLIADLDAHLHSWIFWVKMALVFLLLVNGYRLSRAGRAAAQGHLSAWPQLRSGAIASLTLWLGITLLGAALPNV